MKIPKYKCAIIYVLSFCYSPYPSGLNSDIDAKGIYLMQCTLLYVCCKPSGQHSRAVLLLCDKAKVYNSVPTALLPMQCKMPDCSQYSRHGAAICTCGLLRQHQIYFRSSQDRRPESGSDLTARDFPPPVPPTVPFRILFQLHTEQYTKSSYL